MYTTVYSLLTAVPTAKTSVATRHHPIQVSQGTEYNNGRLSLIRNTTLKLKCPHTHMAFPFRFPRGIPGISIPFDCPAQDLALPRLTCARRKPGSRTRVLLVETSPPFLFPSKQRARAPFMLSQARHGERKGRVGRRGGVFVPKTKHL